MDKIALNIPNTITVFRILLTPVFVILLQKGMDTCALAVFTIAGLSDALDGFIARCSNRRTELGAFLDPIADKMLLIAAFAGLAVFGKIPPWVTIIVISRDVMILMGVAVFTIVGVPFRIEPTWVSKATTFIQIGTVIICLLYVSSPLLHGIRTVLFWMTAGLTAASGGHYLLTGLVILQRSMGGIPPTPPGEE